MLTHDELAIVHLVLNTDCNAWDLAPTNNSPGVCRFCYRERNRVKTDPYTVRRVIDQVRAESEAHHVHCDDQGHGNGADSIVDGQQALPDDLVNQAAHARAEKHE